MKKISQRTMINIILITSLITFGFIGFLSNQEIKKLVVSNRWVDHTYQVIEAVIQSQLDLQDTEFQVSNYIISNSTQTIQSIPTNINNAEQNIRIAKQMTVDNPSQQQRLEQLELLVKTKHLSLQNIIQMQEAGKSDTKVIINSQKEIALNNAISQLYNEITHQERMLLKTRGIKVNYDAQQSISILIFAIILTEILLFCCLILLNINLSKRNHTEKQLIKTLDELKRSNIELEQFAYVASHDLQEPLRMVVSYTQLLERRYSDKLDAAAKEFINYAVDGAKRMQLLLSNLLLYSRINSRESPFTLVNFDKVFKDTIANLDTLLDEKKSIITHSQFPNVLGDEIQLTQLLQNLITNALKFTSPNRRPKIHISAILENKQWIFSVADNGIGIESQYFDKIFIIFKRLHTRTEYVGTGIGLALCKKIVEKHGGRIWLQSEIDKGTTFFFTLPKIKE